MKFAHGLEGKQSMEEITNLLDLDNQSMERFIVGADGKSSQAKQILKWIYQHGVTNFAEMTDLSMKLRATLSEIAFIRLPEVIAEQKSIDGTCKWLFQVDAGNSIETVFIPEKHRGTLCISSQAGCALNCSFCATGKQGFGRNLSISEIIGQVWLAKQLLGCFKHKDRPISNIVMMGMGEPLLNFANVISAIKIMMADQALGLSRKRITLSTAGLVPAIYRLAENSKVNLAVSLHATNDELRDTLVPINKRYPIAELMAACKRYTKCRSIDAVIFEYVMLQGINDSEAEARMLVKLAKDMPAKINLIPFNFFPGTSYTSSSTSTINRFKEILVENRIVTLVRKTRGEDIEAACGQLKGMITARAARPRNQLKVA